MASQEGKERSKYMNRMTLVCCGGHVRLTPEVWGKKRRKVNTESVGRNAYMR